MLLSLIEPPVYSAILLERCQPRRRCTGADVVGIVVHQIWRVLSGQFLCQ